MKLSKTNAILAVFFIILFLFIKSKVSTNYLRNMQLESDPIFLSKVSFWVNLNYQDNLGYSFLHYAVNRGSLVLTRNFLYMGADPNIQNKEGLTPLHLAAMYGMVYITRDLLYFGANPNIQDHYGKTPLFYAVERGSLDMVKLLYKNGANLNIKDNKGNTIFDKALYRHYKNILYFILSHNSLFYQNGFNKDDILFLVQYRKDLMKKRKDIPYYQLFSNSSVELMLLKMHSYFFYKVDDISYYLNSLNQKVKPEADYFFRWLPEPDES